jgi:hypothetical protein
MTGEALAIAAHHRRCAAMANAFLPQHLDVIFPSADLATTPMKEDERNTGK